jgi:hypothetical protein
MKRLIKPLLCAAVGAAAMASVPAHAAGTVLVKFIEPDKFADVRGTHHWVDEGALKALEAYFKAAATPHVPDGETLSIEVLDVDLAGEFRLRFAAWPDVRVMGQGADAPRITLRYTLTSRSGAADIGEVRLSDLGYLFRGAGRHTTSELLLYEKRMIDEWAKSTFAAK